MLRRSHLERIVGWQLESLTEFECSLSVLRDLLTSLLVPGIYRATMMTVIIIKPRARHGSLRFLFCPKLISQCSFAWLAASDSPIGLIQAVHDSGYISTSRIFPSMTIAFSRRGPCGLAPAKVWPCHLASGLKGAPRSSDVIASVLRRC